MLDLALDVKKTGFDGETRQAYIQQTIVWLVWRGLPAVFLGRQSIDFSTSRIKNHGYWYRQVVQRRKGFRFHYPG